LLLAKGYRALTRLLAAGYLEVVFTPNMDDTLDDELRTLKADEYRIWVYGEVTSAELVAALEYRSPRVKVLKLRGDISSALRGYPVPGARGWDRLSRHFSLRYNCSSSSITLALAFKIDDQKRGRVSQRSGPWLTLPRHSRL